MKKILALGFILMLSACAQQGGAPQQLTSEQADARYSARVHTELAAGYYSRVQYGIALDELNRALSADPSYAPAYNMLGLVYMELREDAKAQQNFERALGINPNDSEAHNNFGWFLCTRNRIDESIPHFLKAVTNSLYVSPEKAYFNAGICALKKGDAAAAKDYLAKALARQPLMPQALYQMAVLHFKQGQYIDAKILLTRYAQIATATPDSLWLSVRVERKLGDKESEASYALQLRKAFPDSPQTKLLLGGRYE